MLVAAWRLGPWDVRCDEFDLYDKRGPASDYHPVRRARRRSRDFRRLKVKVPFIQDVNLIDKRVLEWAGNPTDMPTKDKLYISVDLFAAGGCRSSPVFSAVARRTQCPVRLDDILGSETRNAVAKHELIEIIRTTKDRVPLRDTLLAGAGLEQDVGSLVPIQKGRKVVEQQIFAAAAEKVRVFVSNCSISGSSASTTTKACARRSMIE